MNKIIKNLFYINSKPVYNTNMMGKECRELIKSSRRRGNTQGANMSLTKKLARHLLQGNEVTAREISGKFGFADPFAAVRDLRKQGYAVYSNQKTLWTGEQVTKYRIGTPSRAMVAAAYALSGADLF